MAKKRARPDRLDLDAELANVRARLAAGRSMNALKRAKELAKQHPGSATATLLADAYGARIDELMHAGMTAEAREVIVVATERFPELADRWQQRTTNLARRVGDLDDLLHAWHAATEADTRAAVGAELARHLRDPQVIAQSAALPAGDELRQGAAIVARAFAAAAAGTLDEDDRAALRTIPRRSPLAAWRSLTLALDAYHRHDDERCSTLLERIDDTSPAARGKRLLRAILAGEPVTGGGPATARLATRLTDGMHDARTVVEALDAGLPKAADRARAGVDLVVQLASRSPRLAARVVLWMETEPSQRDTVRRLHEVGPRIFGNDEWLRLGTINGDPGLAGEDALLWMTWLFPRPGTLRRLTDIELAAVTVRILDGLRRDCEEVLEFVGPTAIEAIGDRKAVRAIIADLFDGPDAELVQELFGPLLVAWTELLRELRTRTGVHSTVPAPVDELALHALVLDPQSVAVSEILRWLPADARARREQIVAAWAAACPDDPGPWLARAADAEERGALRKALSCLDRAESLAPIDQHVRSARFRLLLAQLRKHARDGRPHLCRRDLTALESLPASRAPLRQTYLQALRVALQAAAPEELAAAVGADRAAAVLDLARADLAARSSRDVCRLQPAAGDNRRDALAVACWLSQVRDAVGARADLALPRDADQAEDADLPDDAELLLSLCGLASDGAPRLLARAAHRGLHIQGPHLPQFLLARARSLATTDVRRSRRCYHLARHFAIRAGDGALARLLDHGIDLDEDTAAGWLREERARPAVPANLAGRRPRSRRRVMRGPELPFASAEPEA